MTANENSIQERHYFAKRVGATLIIISPGKCGLDVPILGAIRHKDGTIVGEFLTPAPTYVLRDALDEAERIFAGDENGSEA